MTTSSSDSYTLSIADASYRWYVTASKRSRRSCRITDVAAVLFSRAREAVEEQRRLFHVPAAPNGDPAARDEELVKAITRIEQAEMGQWVQIAKAGPGTSRKQAPRD